MYQVLGTDLSSEEMTEHISRHNLDSAVREHFSTSYYRFGVCFAGRLVSVPHERREASICVGTPWRFPALLAKSLDMISIHLSFALIYLHYLHVQVSAQPVLFVLSGL